MQFNAHPSALHQDFQYPKTISSLSAPLSSLFFIFTQTQRPFQGYMDEDLNI